VPWVDVFSDPTKPAQPDPTQANYNPVIGRYAYWVEDETSKLDISTVGSQDNVQAFERGGGVDLPNNTPPKLAVNDLDIGALPLVKGSPLTPGDAITNSAILNFRAAAPILDTRFLNRVGGQVTSDVHETAKYYTTAFALSDDLAGNGRRRANLNRLVTSPTTVASKIAGNVDDIAYVISGRHLVASGLGPAPAPAERVFANGPDNYANTLTSFGSRFWTFSPTPTVDQQSMYLERIAANIRDYIDIDQQPTYINTSDQVQSGAE
jgi:hypothetical protein